ncbi:copper chaperone PCu(A)C [Thaumasiovibrio sp. DFM-14]|uniref:copper chaperone PCu(A)C n=1 Tax=Thaumasiovibrio sp. DFM-14 TaxID=3384792 RepID=UPI0039A20AC3
MLRIILSMLCLLPFLFPVHANDISEMLIEKPWSKEVPPSSNVTAGFFVIENLSGQDDKLLSASSPVAGKMELHDHTHENGMMKMRQIDSIALPAGERVALRPGSLHLMLFDLKKHSVDGDVIPVTLQFESAADIEIELIVESALYQP